MRILVLANRFPYPPYRGDKLKIYNLMRRLGRDHELHLLTFSEDPSDIQHVDKLEPFFKSIKVIDLPKWQSYWSCIKAIPSNKPFQVAYFQSSEMFKAVAEAVKNIQPNLVYVQHLRMAQYALNLDLPRILDLPDAFSLYWERRKKTDRPWYNRLFDPIELERLRKYERRMSVFPLNLACSVEDRDYLRENYPKGRFELLRNGVDLETFQFNDHDYSRNTELLFTGNMDYAPNVDAVQYFVSEIFPHILAKRPDVHLTIAGQRPVEAVKRLASDKVTITGFVPDLSEMYNGASVVIAPLRFGAGTQNKVLEAMAMGVPVVCTDVGFKGLEIESGEGVIHAPESDTFATEVLRLLESEEHRKTVGLKGLEVARNKFSWDSIFTHLESYWREIADSSEN